MVLHDPCRCLSFSVARQRCVPTRTNGWGLGDSSHIEDERPAAAVAVAAVAPDRFISPSSPLAPEKAVREFEGASVSAAWDIAAANLCRSVLLAAVLCPGSEQDASLAARCAGVAVAYSRSLSGEPPCREAPLRPCRAEAWMAVDLL